MERWCLMGGITLIPIPIWITITIKISWRPPNQHLTCSCRHQFIIYKNNKNSLFPYIRFITIANSNNRNKNKSRDKVKEKETKIHTIYNKKNNNNNIHKIRYQPQKPLYQQMKYSNRNHHPPKTLNSRHQHTTHAWTYSARNQHYHFIAHRSVIYSLRSWLYLTSKNKTISD